MGTKYTLIVGGAVAVVLAIGLFVLLRDDSDNPHTATESTPATEAADGQPSGGSGQKGSEQTSKDKPSIPTIVVRGGEPVGGVAELSFNAGDEIRFKVISDVADELHLHGYDISKTVNAGGAATFDFPAELEGIFELELEERSTPIAELQVNP